jgi:hypothetical protein
MTMKTGHAIAGSLIGPVLWAYMCLNPVPAAAQTPPKEAALPPNMTLKGGSNAFHRYDLVLWTQNGQILNCYLLDTNSHVCTPATLQQRGSNSVTPLPAISIPANIRAP